MITIEKDTKETRLNDLHNRFRNGLISKELFKKVKENLEKGFRVQYYVKGDIVVKAVLKK